MKLINFLNQFTAPIQMDQVTKYLIKLSDFVYHNEKELWKNK